MATSPQKADAADAAPAKKSKKMLIIIGAVVLLAGGGGGAWFFMNKPQNANAAPKVEAPKAPVFLTLEQFTVNLMPKDAGDQYLQVAITAQLSAQEEVDNLKTYAPQLRSRILVLLSSKTAPEIASPEGKKQLTEELKALIAKPLAPNMAAQKVSDVFFTSFVIQ